MEDTAPVLNAAEARLLGCLIEKEATTPETYPLTVNAAQAAANQKTAREPVMALDPGAVNHALRQLEQKGLAKQVFSSRAERYEHRTAAFFGIPQQQAVLLGLLMLRGAQNGARTARAQRTVVQVQRCGRCSPSPRPYDPARNGARRADPARTGQREDRYMHLLCGPVDVAAIAARLPSASAGEPAHAEIEARVAMLEGEVAALREQLADLLATREA